MFQFFKATNIRRSFLLIVSVIAFGTIGYIVLEDYNLIDAFYMTVITVGTVGFGEVHPLTNVGRLFTSFLILATIGTFAYAFTIIGQSFATGEARRFLAAKYIRRKIDKMKNHVIICGLGRTGRAACFELLSSNSSIVVVDRHGHAKAPKSENIVVIEGEATDDKVLIEACIMSAQAVICTLPSDADNVFVILTAKSLRPDIHVVSRASLENSYDKMLRAGADAVIRPEEIGGNLMANVVLKPDISAFWRRLSFSNVGPEDYYKEIPCSIFPEEAFDKPIVDLHIRRTTGVNIIGYKTAEGEILINPLLTRDLERNGKLFVLGTQAQIELFYEIYSPKGKRSVKS
jgi:voltage-gated potassium channel